MAGLSAWALACFMAGPASGGIVHRYSFSEAPGATTAADSVGTAHGTVLGGAAFTGDGSLALDGVDGYVDLPNGIISSLSDATFEAWVTFEGGTGAWQRIFDFGTNLNGEDAQGEGTTYLFLTPRVGTGGTVRFALRPAQGAPEVPTLNGSGPLPTGQQSHVAVTYDFTNRRAKLFVNGQQVAIGPVATPLSAIQDVNNWLGRSNWPDAYFFGSFNEFRIYDTALSSVEVALSAQAGPDSTTLGDPGAVQSVTLSIPNAEMLVGTTQQAAATANYANLGAVVVTAESNTTYQSSNPNVASVSATGLITGVTPGTATITVSHGGQQATQVVQVNAAVAPPAQLRHRYSFNETSGDVAEDSVGDADGRLIRATFTGDGKVDLQQANSAYVDLPNGIISSLSNASFEAWFTFDGEPGAWQRVFDFGNNSNGEDQQGTGTTYLFLTARVGTGGVLRFAATLDPNGTPREIPILDGPTVPVGEPVHVVVTYGVSNGEGRLYYNGALVATGQVTLPLRAFQDVNNWLGRSNWPDAFFDGQIDEFRIYEGILTPLQVALNAAAGPDVLGAEPGALQSIRVQVDTPTLAVGGLPAQLTVFADFANVSGVNVSALEETTYASSNPGVATVSATGQVSPVASGSTIITASYGGKQATVEVTVAGPVGPPAALIHRYSFNTPADGFTVEDSVGDADGFLNDFIGDGSVGFSDGRLTLANPQGNVVDSYVEFPAGIVSSIPSGSASFEAWVTWNSTRTWERIFDFGGGQGNYLFLTPLGGTGVLRFAITVGAGETPVLNGPVALPRGQEVHVAVVYNMAGGVAHLYYNGQRVASGAATIPLNQINDIQNWLGRSQWPDPGFVGQFNEFRIYDGALTDEQIAISAAAGPDTLGATPGDLQSLAVTLGADTITVGGLGTRATATANFANVQNVNVTTLPTTQWSSSNPSVATISADGVIQAVSAGTVTITARFGGREATATLTVNASQRAARLIHRYSFSEDAGSTVIEDSIGDADGELRGTGGTLGGGQLRLDGTDAYVNLPNGIISALEDATFEVWVTPRMLRTWERIFDFGNNSNGEDQQGTGTTFLYLSPQDNIPAVRVGYVTGVVPNLDFNNNPPSVLPQGEESHVALVINDTLNVAHLYINGRRVASAENQHHLADLDDVNNWLGRSNWPDPFFTGDFNEFRIYEGALTDAQVAATFAAGPDTVPPDLLPAAGTTLSIALSGNVITIAWPVEPAGFTPESTTTLGPTANWTPLGGTPTVENGVNKLTVPVAGNSLFIRLRSSP